MGVWSSAFRSCELIRIFGVYFLSKTQFWCCYKRRASYSRKTRYIWDYKTLWKLGCSSTSLFFKLFDAQIVPSLLYGSELWGIKARESIEKVHIQACKLFLNVPPQPPQWRGVRRIGNIPTVDAGCSSLCAILVPSMTTALYRYSRKAYDICYVDY